MTGPPATERFVSEPSLWFCLVSPDDGECGDKTQGSGEGEEDRKPRRKAYVHKPFLYSRYYSDSDDEVTVEERRRSAVSSRKTHNNSTLTCFEPDLGGTFCHDSSSLCSSCLSQAKDKEERLLKRQQNRERLEEKRKLKAVLTEEHGT